MCVLGVTWHDNISAPAFLPGAYQDRDCVSFCEPYNTGLGICASMPQAESRRVSSESEAANEGAARLTFLN